MPELTLENFTEEDVIHWLGASEVAKARSYVSRVQDLEVDDARIRGVVPGTARMPYVTVIRLVVLKRGERDIVTGCTCPVATHCKHAAALLLRAIDDRDVAERVSPSVMSWVEDLRRASVAVAKKKVRSTAVKQQLFYVLKYTNDERHFGVEIRKGKHLENADEWWKIDRALVTPPSFVDEEDLAILRLLWADRSHDAGLRAFGLGPKHGAEALLRMAKSGRLYPDIGHGLPLQSGEARPATVGWKVDVKGFQRPYLKPVPAASLIVPVNPPYYLDLDEGEVGELEVSGNPAVISRLFSLPPLSAKEAALVAGALHELAPDLPSPAEDASERLRLIDAPLQAVLQLDTLHTHGNQAWREYPHSYSGGLVDIAKVVIRYADADIAPDNRHEFITLPEGETVRLKRRPEAEAKVLSALAESVMQKIPVNQIHTKRSPPEGM